MSVKGEDILLQLATDIPARYHRLRVSIPGKLWRWRDVVGWRWTGEAEHINALELRAVKTAVVWRIRELQETKTKFLHLVDSLVVLHALSRGRSSSRKLRSPEDIGQDQRVDACERPTWRMGLHGYKAKPGG